MTQRNERQVGLIVAAASSEAARSHVSVFTKIIAIFQIVVLALIFTVAQPDSAFAAKKKSKSKKAKSTISKTVQKPDVGNPKYAAIVIDAETGQVLHEANSDSPRHPASLTKMMTLYMLFDALEKGKVSMRDSIKVSPRAASMPKTNLSLSGGERIPVETAIKALVVRSANDIASAVGEHLGGSEYQFAVAMTTTARNRLGMKSTTYKNASGLPDAAQITTAHDLARLSLALRHDFPQYYHYFDTRSFSYGGREYTTHNRVLVDMPGVDGLKTGYINMSGFNLATSIKRDGYSLVAVVMGGRTGRSRDDHMKTLLVKSLRQVASMHKPGDKNYAASAPAATATTAASAQPVPVAKPAAVASVEAETGMGDVGAIDTALPTVGKAYVPAGSSPRPFVPGMDWGIQVGAFSESRDAFMAAVNAMNIASAELKGSEINVIDPQGDTGRVYRARIARMNEAQARRACRVLLARKENCFVYQQGPNG